MNIIIGAGGYAPVAESGAVSVAWSLVTQLVSTHWAGLVTGILETVAV